MSIWESIIISTTPIDKDFMTDDGEEHEVNHGACELRWKQSDEWKKETQTDPWVEEDVQ